MTGAGVLQVVAILEQTRSSYLSTFLSLRKAIQQEAVVAEDNLKFLQCLEQPCRTLASATAKVPPSCMPGSDRGPSWSLISQTLVIHVSPWSFQKLSCTCNTINTACQRHLVQLKKDSVNTVQLKKDSVNTVTCILPAMICRPSFAFFAGHSQDSALGPELCAYDLELESFLQHTRTPCWSPPQAQQ